MNSLQVFTDLARKEYMTKTFKWILLVCIIVLFTVIIISICRPRLLIPGGVTNQIKTRDNLIILKEAQAKWKGMDYDRNGIKDYWTYDVSCLYRMKDMDGNSVKAIDIQFAKADTSPTGDDVFVGVGHIQKSLVATPTAYSGYHYRAMLYDENGIPYNQNTVSETKVKATNSTKWAIVAYPEYYGTSGYSTFIINQEGIIYSTDCGSNYNSDKVVLQWPAKDPTKVKGPGGKEWLKYE
jgi:hypothetical protein